MDDILFMCNETELLSIARQQGLGFLRRGLPLEELVAIVSGQIEVKHYHLADSTESRYQLAKWFHNPTEFPPEPGFENNWGRLRSQLPGCTGICTKYKCSEGTHAGCYENYVRATI